jgi:hypothetical protein
LKVYRVAYSTDDCSTIRGMFQDVQEELYDDDQLYGLVDFLPFPKGIAKKEVRFAFTEFGFRYLMLPFLDAYCLLLEEIFDDVIIYLNELEVDKKEVYYEDNFQVAAII